MPQSTHNFEHSEAWDEEMDELESRLESMVVATSDHRDEAIPHDLQRMLKVLREQIRMDVVFVSRFEDGQRKFVAVDTDPGQAVIQPGMSDPIEESWCHHIVQGRMPRYIRNARPLVRDGKLPHTPLEIGTHLSVPVVMSDGNVYGTLCAFSMHVHEDKNEEDVRRLQNIARLVSQRIGSI
ncbi:GAF domain-containing protein [Caenimonas sp. SL110]|uniref:GAF domain-containing protein n=1 Tax=Caenimonas sp. SL110 TaxID=1450524 RepID=UPI00069DFE49|nr:GAF domain-containing protein [Caenimonas sp. SL110]